MNDNAEIVRLRAALSRIAREAESAVAMARSAVTDAASPALPLADRPPDSRPLVASMASWALAALRLGEELASVGPDGYYTMTPEEWLTWALATVQARATEDSQSSRLRSQAVEISSLLAEAGVGACTVPEGVRILIHALVVALPPDVPLERFLARYGTSEVPQPRDRPCGYRIGGHGDK